MDKLITFEGRSERGIFTYVVDTESPHLIKTASEYHPEIASYIRSAKTIPGKTQVLLTALGAGEYWGANSNGDWFGEDSLAHPGEDYGYRTFLKAHAFKHHVNKDPAASYGDVTVAVYNPIFHRVELIIVLDNAKSGDLIDKINNGEYPSWSMGAKLPYDVCSVCGNKARTRAEYCDHLRYYMGRLDPATGKLVYAINPNPKFFDISYVFIGADKIAKTLKKVASLGGYNKTAEIKKEIPAEPPASQDSLEDDIKHLNENDPDIPTKTLDSIASKGPLREVLSTLLASRIVPRPHEFQRIVLVSRGHRDLADHWEREGMHFDPSSAVRNIGSPISISGDNINSDILDALSSIIPQRSFSPQHMMNRVIVLVKRANKKGWVKISEEKVPRETSHWSSAKQIATATIIASLYNHVMKDAGKDITGEGFKAMLLKNPKLAALLGFSAMVAPIFFGKSILPSTNGNYVKMNTDDRSLYQRRPTLLKSGEHVGAGMAATFGAPIVTGLMSDYLQKKRMHDPEYQEGAVKSFIRKYKEPAQLLSSAVGLGLLTGRPIPTKLYNLASAGLKTIEKAIPHVKMGGISEFSIDTLVWPLAMGGPNLAHRLVGSAIDQTVFEGLKHLSNKRRKDKLT